MDSLNLFWIKCLTQVLNDLYLVVYQNCCLAISSSESRKVWLTATLVSGSRVKITPEIKSWAPARFHCCTTDSNLSSECTQLRTKIHLCSPESTFKWRSTSRFCGGILPEVHEHSSQCLSRTWWWSTNKNLASDTWTWDKAILPWGLASKKSPPPVEMYELTDSGNNTTMLSPLNAVDLRSALANLVCTAVLTCTLDLARKLNVSSAGNVPVDKCGCVGDKYPSRTPSRMNATFCARPLVPDRGNRNNWCNSSYSGCSGSAGSAGTASRAPEEEAEAMATAKKALQLITKRNEFRAAVLFLEPKRQVRQQFKLSSDLQTEFPA